MVLDIASLLGAFLDEAEDHLDNLSAQILLLEREPADRAVLDEIFRIAHSLKGASASFGLQGFSVLAHQVETVLNPLRKGEAQVDASMIDLLFRAVDAFRAFVAEMREQTGEGEPTLCAAVDLYARLAEFVPKAVSESEDAIEGAAVASRRRRRDLRWLAGVVESLGEGQHAVHVRVRFESDTPMVGMRAYLMLTNWKGLGEVLHCYPVQDDLEKAGFDGAMEGVLAVEAEGLGDAISRVDEASRIDLVEHCEVQAFDLRAEDAEALPEPRAAEAPSASTAPAKPWWAKLGHGDSQLRVDAAKIERLLWVTSELVSNRNTLAQELHRRFPDLKPREERELAELLDKADALLRLLQEEVTDLRMVSLRNVLGRMPRIVRDLGRHLGKEIRFFMEGQETQLDKKLVDRIGDPLVHLLRNAVDHGIETAAEREAAGKPARGTIQLSAFHSGPHVCLRIEDDGRGIDPVSILAKAEAQGILPPEDLCTYTLENAHSLLFLPGFSTRDEVTEISGRGVGLDVVAEAVKKLSGEVRLESWPGKGTRFTIQLPLTQAVVRVLLVALGDETYAVPIANVMETLREDVIVPVDLAGGPDMVRIREQVMPLLSLGRILGTEGYGEVEGWQQVLVADVEGRNVALLVDRFIGEQELVVKSLADHFRHVDGISGASILGDGRVALILDVPALVERHGGTASIQVQRERFNSNGVGRA